MKIHRLVLLATVVTLLLIGLISLPFLPSIAAMLTLSAKKQAMQSYSSSNAYQYPAAMPTSTTKPGMSMPTGTPVTVKTAPMNPMQFALDTFQRPDSPRWGTASDGHMWQADASMNPSFVITDRSGRIVNGHSIYNAVIGPRVGDSQVLFSGFLSSFQQNNMGAVLRWQDDNNWYKAYINGTQLILLKNVQGVMTQLQAVPFPASANASYSLRFKVTGSTLSARVWLTGQPEPVNWMVMATDTSITSGFGGLRLVLEHGANATITSFQELDV